MAITLIVKAIRSVQAADADGEQCALEIHNVLVPLVAWRLRESGALQVPAERVRTIPRCAQLPALELRRPQRLLAPRSLGRRPQPHVLSPSTAAKTC